MIKLLEEKISGPIFSYYPPKLELKGIISIPHSGLETPEEVKSYLLDDQHILNTDVDFGVHHLLDIESCNNNGLAVIVSHIHRTSIDLNRPREKSLLNWKQTSKGVAIVTKEPGPQESEKILAKYYDPYFSMLYALIDNLKTAVDKPIFIDLHSMPSRATAYHMRANPEQDEFRPDFCLSDVHGTSATKEFIEGATKIFIDSGFNAQINKPYFGGHITRHINDKYTDINNIQIEINRSLYMNELSISLKSDNTDFKGKLTKNIISSFNL